MMTMTGGCRCLNIHFNLQLSTPPSSYSPRACDCDFCVEHGASYLSDPKGSLSLSVKDPTLLKKLRQGSQTAQFLCCAQCGALVAVSYEEKGQIFAAINTGAIDPAVIFGEKVKVSPKLLSKEEKAKRWKEVWFSNVIFSENGDPKK